MKKRLLFKIFTAVIVMALSSGHFNNARAQISIQNGATITEDFSIGTTATAATPANWKADKNTTVRTVGTYSAAGSATERLGGDNLSTTAGNGIYNFAAGDQATASDRAIGGLSSSSASKSVNVYTHLQNNGPQSIKSFSISYDVERYRNGTNAAGFAMQLYYSTDGAAWTAAGDAFITSFAANSDNLGFASAPGETKSVTNKGLNVTVPAGGSIYFAWNYSVASGTTTSNSQALGLDNVSITANPGILVMVDAPTFNPTAQTFTAPLSVTISSATAGATIYYTTDGSTPDNTKTLYTAPVSIGSTTTLKAIAYSGPSSSTVTTATYESLIPATATLPYSQSFASSMGDFIRYSAVGDQVWEWKSNDSGSMSINGFSGGAKDNEDWLISPTFDFTGLNSIDLDFSEAINYITAYSDMTVWASTNYTGGNPALATWAELTVNNRAAGSSATLFGNVETIELNDYANQSAVNIAFKYKSNTSGASNWLIGSVSVTGSTAMPPVEPTNHVSNFLANSAGITTSTIKLEWTENDGTNVAEGYLIVASDNAVTAPVDKVDPTLDYDLSDGTALVKVNHGTATYTFDNLLAGTAYHFGIYPYQGTGSKINFKTAGAPTIQVSTKSPGILLNAPVFNPLGGTFTDSVVIALTTQTDEAQIFYTLDGTTPTNASTLYAGPFKLTQSATVKAYTYKNGAYSNVSTQAYEITVTPTAPQKATIAELRTGLTDGTEYKFTGQGVVTVKQDSRNQKFIQDATGAILIDDSQGLITSAVEVGQAITNLTGTLTLYNGLMQFIPKGNAEVVASPNFVPAAQELTVTELQTNFEQYESELVLVKNLTFTSTGTFAASKNYNTTDGSKTLVFRTNFGKADYIGTSIPTATKDITGIAIEFNGTAQLAARNLADFVDAAPITVAAPDIKVVDTGLSGEWIVITTTTAGATIYYTLDGTVPTTSSTVYTDSIAFPGTVTVKAIAVLNNVSSEVSTGSFVDPSPTVSAPMFEPSATTFADSIQIMLFSSTEGASIYYTTDGTVPSFENSTLYSAPFKLKETTTLKAVAMLNGKSSTVASATFTKEVAPTVVEVATLAELRAGLLDGTVYKYTGEGVITFKQASRNQKYIQDATAAILIDDSKGLIKTAFEVGQAVTNLSGTLLDYSGLLEFIPTTDAGVVAEPEFTPTAQAVTIEELKANFNSYESELVVVSDLTFADAGTFVKSKNYNVTSGDQTLVFRTAFATVDYIGTDIPTSAVHITGIPIEYNGTAQLVARSLADFEDGGMSFEGPEIAELTQTPEAPLATEAVVVSAKVTSELGVSSVVLKWGTTAEMANEPVVMTANGDVYTATIPAQAEGTTVWYQLIATDVLAWTANSDVVEYTIPTPGDKVAIYSEAFNGNLGTMTAFSVSGDQKWVFGTYSGKNYAKVSGYTNACNANEDWLISPAISLENFIDVTLSFENAFKFDGVENDFTVQISTNYVAGTDPTTATWVQLSDLTLSPGNYEFVSNVSALEQFEGKTIFVAFKYMTDGTLCSTWEVANVVVEGNPLGAYVEAPVISKASGSYFETISVEITSATEGAAIHYTIDGTTPTEASTLYTQALELSANTTLNVIAIKEGTSSTVTTATYTITLESQNKVTTLAELRKGLTDGTVYKFTGTAVITMIQSSRNQKFIQDETGAILIDDPDGKIATAFEMGQGITNIEGTLLDYSGLLEFVPVKDAQKVENPAYTPVAQLLTVTEIKANFEQYESELVKIEKVLFADAGTFAGGKNYNISTNDDLMVFRTNFRNADYIGAAIPVNPVNVTGVLIEYNGTAQIAARFASDIEIRSSVIDIQNNVKIATANSKVMITRDAAEAAQVEVFDLNGRKLIEQSIEGTYSEIELNRTGIFVVRYTTPGKVSKVAKINIR
jgi:hypothetical protein